jgi:protein-tyrosine sulfotransferase
MESMARTAPVRARLRAPIFLLGSHKSGTSLLRSLLDGHEQLVVFPKETDFFQSTGHWVDYALRRSLPVASDRAGALEGLIRNIETYSRAIDDPYSDSPGFAGYDLDRFVSYVKSAAPATGRELFEAYAGGLSYSLLGDALADQVRIVDKSVVYAEYARVLRSMFPDCLFVHIVRDPYAAVVAIRKALVSRSRRWRPYYPPMGRVAMALHNSYYYLVRNQAELDGYLVLKYEDLIEDTEGSMRHAAGFLGIDFAQSLLTPTCLGRQWEGNSTSGERFGGVSRAPLEAWRKSINHFEIELANRIAAQVVERYGYERVSRSRSISMPVWGEGVRTYLHNRALLSLY